MPKTTTALDQGTLRKLIPDWFKQFPVGRTLLAETESRTMAERTGFATDLEKVRDEAQRELPALRADVDGADKRVRMLREKLAGAESELGEARARLMVRSSYFNAQISRLEAELRESAAEEISEFIAEMRTLYEHDRRQLRAVERPGRLDLITFKRKPMVATNARSLEARLAAIGAAIAEAEILKQELIPTEELPARLAALRNTIPPLETNVAMELEPLR